MAPALWDVNRLPAPGVFAANPQPDKSDRAQTCARRVCGRLPATLKCEASGRRRRRARTPPRVGGAAGPPTPGSGATRREYQQYQLEQDDEDTNTHIEAESDNRLSQIFFHRKAFGALLLIVPPEPVAFLDQRGYPAPQGGQFTRQPPNVATQSRHPSSPVPTTSTQFSHSSVTLPGEYSANRSASASLSATIRWLPAQAADATLTGQDHITPSSLSED